MSLLKIDFWLDTDGVSDMIRSRKFNINITKAADRVKY
jgi:hypothetical protein